MPDVEVFQDDCLGRMTNLARAGRRVQAIATDPPYGLGFMGRHWDHGVPGVAFWKAAALMLPPGGHLVAFGGTRTWHRLTCAIEDAGFEIRDVLLWLYGSGWPKSREVLKPAWEPIILARRPIEGTLAKNVLKHGVGGLNIDACRIDGEGSRPWRERRADPDIDAQRTCVGKGLGGSKAVENTMLGRWPANVVTDGGEEVAAALAVFGDDRGAFAPPTSRDTPTTSTVLGGSGRRSQVHHGDSGSALRFFYSAKADKQDRWGSKHPTVKPIALMRWLCRLITPPGGTVLDPFAGSGTTGVAALADGFDAVLIEREAEHVADIRTRLEWYRGEGGHRLAALGRHVEPEKAGGADLPLFKGPGLAEGGRATEEDPAEESLP